MTEHKPPYETPDAVISAGLHHHKRLDGGRWFAFRVRIAKALKYLIGRSVPKQTFMLWIIYREWQEKVQIVTLEAGTIGPFVDSLMAAPMIRQVHVAELWFKGRKSFGIDYDPTRMSDFLEKVVAEHKTKAASAAAE